VVAVEILFLGQYLVQKKIETENTPERPNKITAIKSSLLFCIQRGVIFVA
jgi:hypothetical protein